MPLRTQPSPMDEKAQGTELKYGAIVSLKLPGRPMVKGMLSKRHGVMGIINIHDPDFLALVERVNRIPGGKVLKAQIPFFPLQIEHIALLKAHPPFKKFKS